MQASLMQLISILRDEFGLAERLSERSRRSRGSKSTMVVRAPWFNVPDNYQQAIADTLHGQRRVVKLLADRKTWPGSGSGSSTPIENSNQAIRAAPSRSAGGTTFQHHTEGQANGGEYGRGRCARDLVGMRKQPNFYDVDRDSRSRSTSNRLNKSRWRGTLSR